ncbi:pyridoxal-phosphate-dependent aminotransferase family protein [Vibrio ostreicida]|uniref:Aminotransferase class V-fold PLP-dependent enzyme n=1 Tax=Vibrio ostreicida TaxID=526588 RepID=A0ABT8BQU8_9VIBR|nr:aminotransferase class V-fold PLP-dependent enzyme [Vibrio ostreicida]MDN3608483.1 aminotransferase class V-fold PLP-dependent enzyme [Vibrio ostreicida]NPD10305.1 alanine--glyoxylate aminotransferase family protein [Vibrio ostreicida]
MNNKFYNFTPGPVPMEESVREVLTHELPYFRTKEFSKLTLKCKQNLLKMFNAGPNSDVIFLSATGTAAMEASILNLVLPEHNSLVINGGGFAQRFIDILNRHKKSVQSISLNCGDATVPVGLDLDNVDNLIVNGHETTTGALYNLSDLGALCKQTNCKFIVDGISMAVTDEIDILRDGIDCLIISSHKAFGLHPGMSFIILSEGVIPTIQQSEGVPLYFDFSLYLRDIDRGQLPFTPSISVLIQLNAFFDDWFDKGNDFYIERAKELSLYFRTQILEKKLPLYEYANRLPNAMTSVEVGTGMNARDIVERLIEKNIFVAPSGGELESRIFRVSHMGNQTKKDIDVLIRELTVITKGINE